MAEITHSAMNGFFKYMWEVSQARKKAIEDLRIPEVPSEGYKLAFIVRRGKPDEKWITERFEKGNWVPDDV